MNAVGTAQDQSVFTNRPYIWAGLTQNRATNPIHVEAFCCSTDWNQIPELPPFFLLHVQVKQKSRVAATIEVLNSHAITTSRHSSAVGPMNFSYVSLLTQRTIRTHCPSMCGISHPLDCWLKEASLIRLMPVRSPTLSSSKQMALDGIHRLLV